MTTSYCPRFCREGGIAVEDWRAEPVLPERFRAVMAVAEQDERLNNDALRALLEILRAIREGSTPSYAEMARSARLKLTTYKRRLLNLIEFGYVERIRRWCRAEAPPGWWGEWRRAQATTAFRVYLPVEAAEADLPEDEIGDDPSEVLLAVMSADGTVVCPSSPASSTSVDHHGPPSLNHQCLFGEEGEVELVDKARDEDEALNRLLEAPPTHVDDGRAVMRRTIEGEYWRRPQIVVVVGPQVEAMRGLRWGEALAILRRRAESAYPRVRWWFTVRRELRDDLLVETVGPAGPEVEALKELAARVRVDRLVPHWLEARV